MLGFIPFAVGDGTTAQNGGLVCRLPSLLCMAETAGALECVTHKEQSTEYVSCYTANNSYIVCTENKAVCLLSQHIHSSLSSSGHLMPGSVQCNLNLKTLEENRIICGGCSSICCTLCVVTG